MAATSVKLLFTDRGGSDDLDNHRTYTRMYEVLTDDPEDDEQIVGNADVDGVAVPQVGTGLDSDEEAVVFAVEARQSDDSPLIWYVTVEYDSDPPGANRDRPDNRVDFDENAINKERQSNPLDEPATWTLTFQDTDEPAIEWIPVNGAGDLVITVPQNWVTATAYKLGDYRKNGANVYVCTTPGTSAAGPAGVGTGIADGTVVWAFYATFAQTQNDPNWAVRSAILTSGKVPFDPPPMMTVSRVVLSVTKNMPIATLEYLLQLKNAVNVSVWRGIPPRCAKIFSVSHDGGKEQNGVQYVTTKWEIGLDPDTWDLRILDAGEGTLQLVTPDGGGPQVTKYILFLDVHGQPLGQVPMNGAGSPLTPGDAPVFLRGVPRQCRLIDFNTVLPF